MCGRTACALAPGDVVKACCYKDGGGKCRQPLWVDAPSGQQYTPAYNMAPGAFTPVLLSTKHLSAKTEQHCQGESSDSDRVIMPMKWGLVPAWYQGDPYKVPYETNNCRAESMLEKKTFKVPLVRGNRCVVLADGFYEWKSSKDGKQPYYFYFPQNNTMTSSLNREMCEFSNQKTVKEEKLPNMKHTFEGKKVFCPDMENDLYLETSDNALFEKERYETSEFESTADTSPLQKQAFYGDSSSYTGSKNEYNISKPFCKQELYEHSGKFDENRREEEADEKDTSLWKGHRLLTMAGVFDVWRDNQNGLPIYSYSVITVTSSKDMDWCHHRMPAILATEKEVQNWLDFSSLPLSEAALLIKPKVCLVHHAVSKQVNNSRYQAPDSVRPVQIGQAVSSPGSKLMQQWLQSASPGKRKLQDCDSSLIDSKSRQESVSKKNKKIGGGSLMMNWLKSGSLTVTKTKSEKEKCK